MVQRGRLQVRFSPPRPRGVQPGSGTCREHNCGGGGGGIGVWRASKVRLRPAQPELATNIVTDRCCVQV